MSTRSLVSAWSALVLGMALAIGPFAVAPAAAKPPTYPLIEHDKDNYSREMTLIFWNMPDPGGPRTFWISCDGGANRSSDYPYAHEVPHISLDLPGCEGYGLKTVDVQLEDQDHQGIYWTQVTPGIAPRMTMSMPLPAITGHTFTLAPQYPADYDLPADSTCQWEFWWGDDQSLDDRDFDETYGSLSFETDAKDGDCPAWTFTLPWVPYPQFRVFLRVGLLEDGERAYVSGVNVTLKASVDGTNRRITSSNIGIAQILPSTYTPIVGQPITYTRYLVGGAGGGGAVWDARQGKGDNPIHWTQDGGATFTITPHEPGNVVVGWQRMHQEKLFAAQYDPPVRYRDHVKPTATTPKVKLAGGTFGDRVPVTLTWDGHDTGWGINRFQLERRTDGGAWKRVLSKKVRHRSELLATGHRYQYRVRAIDDYGNRGSWRVGSSFRPKAVGDGASSVAFNGAWSNLIDAAAAGGSLRESDATNAKATFTFTGRDVAWVAERGPGHGKAAVYLDGKQVATVDLNAAADSPRRIVFPHHWASVGTHHLRIVVAGTATRPTVDVDAFLVLR